MKGINIISIKQSVKGLIQLKIARHVTKRKCLLILRLHRVSENTNFNNRVILLLHLCATCVTWTSYAGHVSVSTFRINPNISELHSGAPYLHCQWYFLELLPYMSLIWSVNDSGHVRKMWPFIVVWQRLFMDLICAVTM